MANFVPSAEAKKSPRRIRVTTGENSPNIWVGVGGTIDILPNPPIHRGYTVKEATQSQYKILFERGLRHLVEKIEKASQPTQASSKKEEKQPK